MGRTSSTVSDGLKRVPPFPPVAAKLLSLLSKPEVETNGVAQLISGDATFTARLLQRVNSVEFGLVTPVTNVRQAVALLGLDLTRQVILSHATAAYAKRCVADRRTATLLATYCCNCRPGGSDRERLRGVR